MSFAHVPSHNISLPPPCTPSSANLKRICSFSDTPVPPFHFAPALAHFSTRLPCSPRAASTTEHQMGWHRLVARPNGCLFKHWSCLHCCGSLHVKHSPLKPYANPIKVSAVQCGEAITVWSQVCLLSSRKGNLIEQLKGKSDSAQHHVEDTGLTAARSVEGRGKSMTSEGGPPHLVKRAVSQPVRNSPLPLPRNTACPVLSPQLPFSFFLFLPLSLALPPSPSLSLSIPRVYLFIF